MILFSVQSINVLAMFLAHLTVHVPKSNVASMMPQPRLVTELPALEFWIHRAHCLDLDLDDQKFLQSRKFSLGFIN